MLLVLMKTLFLCVDRDDDLGRKGGVETPIVGRRRIVDAAMRLGLADPEDSDTNALLATIHMYDKELKSSQGEHQMEVAAIAGHRLVGLRSDRELAKQLDEVMAITQADEIVLVTDGAEDEAILPILHSRARVAHIHRSIVKQAPRLEGAWYVLQRMMDDDKIAKQYVLPVALVMFVWGLAFLFGLSGIATGLTLAILGGWLIVHSMRWEEKVAKFFTDFNDGLRTGKVSLVANIVMLIIFIVGIAASVDRTSTQIGWAHTSLTFADAFLLFLVSGLLVRTAGNLIDDVLREGKASVRYWTFSFTIIAFGFIGGVVLDLAIQLLEGGAISELTSFDLVMRLLLGLGIMTGGIILRRWAHNFFRDDRDLHRIESTAPANSAPGSKNTPVVPLGPVNASNDPEEAPKVNE